MVQIAYIQLCHKDPEAVVAQARRLTAAGDCVSIHFDRRAPAGEFEQIQAALTGAENVTFASRRIRCGWGEWSLVQATLNAIDAALAAFPGATHFHLLSGDCMPVKPAEFIHAFLGADDADHIESVDFYDGGWIKTGFRDERLEYRHYFNERRQRRLFYRSLELQKWLGLKRTAPKDLQVMIGSQWWSLRRRTVEAVLAFVAERNEIVRFFSTTWIPDEIFFQTLVRHLVPRQEIRSRSLTFLMFSDYGMPVTFYNDHHDLLLHQDALFARKISPEARDLKSRLGDLYAAKGVEVAISDNGRSRHRFLTGQGRNGLRFGQRFWEASNTLGHDRELMVIVCRKWHVAKRLVGVIRAETGLPAVDFLFSEEDTALPDLGGIEKSVRKRMRHRRVLLGMLFDRFGSNRLLICVDPSMIDVLRDFAEDRCVMRLLEVAVDYDDTFLLDHARRIGLTGGASGAADDLAMLPALRNEVKHLSDTIRDAGFPHQSRILQGATPAENAVQLSGFLTIPEETAMRIAAMDNLFDD